MSFLAKLSSETLSNLAESNFKVVPKKKANLVRQFKEDIDDSGVKGLAYSMKALELSEVCNYLEIDHQDNNPKNRMVLSKRFMESVRETGLEKWFSDCDDLSVIRIICEALGLEVSEEDSCEELCQNAIREIRTHGAQMVLSRMSVAQLKQCCEEMELQNWDLCSSKSALIKAIITQSDVEVKDVARKVAAKKLPIHKCTEYEQLFQHYYREDLSEFCRRHKLKTSGTKKELINRILSFNLGEEESENQTPNTAATKSKGKKKPAAKKAKSTKKPAAKPASPADEDSEEEQPASDEEQNDEPADEDESAEEVPPPKVDSKKAKDAKSSTKKPASDSKKDAAKQETTKAPAKSSRKSVLESDDEASDEAEPNKDEEPSEEAEPAKPASKSEKKSAEKPLPKKAKLPERSSTAEDPFAPTRLDGKTVAIGSAKGFKRTMAEIHRLIESAGGVPDKTLSKRTNFLLVVDPEDTSKKAIVAARKLNVPVVSEDFLRNLSA